MLTIDGSYNEGGGQILRTALTLSLATRTPFRIDNIRAGRKKPGLLRQHLAAVTAATQVGNAEVQGDEINSQSLTFAPRDVTAGDYDFSIGTAGSTTLVLQTVLPVLMLAARPSTLTLEGGTHNPAAPPFDFLARVYVPLLQRMGARIHAELITPGFYPAGGGKLKVTIEPPANLLSLDLIKRGEVRRCSARALVSNLSLGIGERELAVVGNKLAWEPSSLKVESVSSRGPGNVLLLEVACDNVTELFSGFGERNVRAETVAENAAGEARKYLAAGVAVGQHLADQLLLPLALAKGGAFTTLSLSRHAQTNIETIQKFLPVKIHVREDAKRHCTVEVDIR